MIYHQTPLKDALVIDLEKREDDRGFFARTYCAEEFAKQGMQTEYVQANTSLSIHEGTLRGMHYQLPPMQEAKLVRCTRGSLWDAIIDVRPDSPTFGQWFGAELSADNRRMMYVPQGFAHGFITLEPMTEVFYLVSQYYSPQQERGIRWNDPRFNIRWPQLPKVISDKDRVHPDYE